MSCKAGEPKGKQNGVNFFSVAFERARDLCLGLVFHYFVPFANHNDDPIV